MILLFILLLFLLTRNIEKFDVVSDNLFTNYEKPYISNINPKPKTYLSQLTKQSNPNVKCCIVSRDYVKNNKNVFNGDFKYIYKIETNDKCNLDLYNLDTNKQLFIDGENGWNNKNCNEKQNVIGSCRLANKECIDFVDKNTCDKLKMRWSNLTCRNPLPFNFVDRIDRPKFKVTKNDGVFNMFPDRNRNTKTNKGKK